MDVLLTQGHIVNGDPLWQGESRFGQSSMRFFFYTLYYSLHQAKQLEERLANIFLCIPTLLLYLLLLHECPGAA